MLNDTGRRQAKYLAMSIKEKHYDYCYMSPLVRCVETALILIGDRVEMIPEKRLIERGLGQLEGRPGEEYNSYSFWDYDKNRNDYDVEPIQDVFKRCSEFLDYIKEKHAGKDILIVTHSAPYRALKHLLLGHELKGNLLGDEIPNCKLEEFEI